MKKSYNNQLVRTPAIVREFPVTFLAGTAHLDRYVFKKGGFMKCPVCNSNISFRNTFKILNPHKFKCMHCGVLLALDKAGVIAFYLYALVGAGMLGFYFYLIEAHIGTPLIRGGIFFGYLVPATIAFYWAMAKMTHLVRRNEK